MSESTTVSDGSPRVSPARANGVLISLALMGFLMVTNEVMPFGLINLMAADLDRSQSEIGLLVTGFALVVAVVSVPLALLTKRIPRRQLLTATMLVWVAGALVAATADDYSALMVGRVLTALAQAIYWAVVMATVAGLFPARVRGKILSRLLLGPACANLIGLPATTYLGQQYGWHTPFYVVAGIGVALAVAIAVLVPSYRPEAGMAARGTKPHLKRFIALLVVVLFAILGLMTVYTYITPYLTEVTAFAESTMPWLLTAAGIAGVTGTLVAGKFLDRYPLGTLTTGLAMLATGWVGMIVLGTVKPVAAVLFVVVGAGFSVVVAGLVNRVMQLSPGSTDLGIAFYGSAYNLGIAGGSFLGAEVLQGGSPGPLPVFGAVFVGVALAVLWAVNAGNARRRAQGLKDRAA